MNPPTLSQTIMLLGYDVAPWVQLSRIQKYSGVFFLFWPCAWAITMAARVFHLSISTFFADLGYAFLFANILRRCEFLISPIPPLIPPISAGCIWNDILDRNFDRQVERTKNRPLANGSATVPGALVFLFFHLIFLVAMLYPLNMAGRQVGLVGIFVLPGVYPLMKRITYWPQAWLGLTMNIGIPLAWTSLSGSCPFPAMVFYLGTWAWSMWYDTIYACQDKKDDAKAGVKSTTLIFGDDIKIILALFGLLLLTCFTAAGYISGGQWPYFAISIFGGFLHLAWQLWNVDLDDPKSCWKTFELNAYSFGFIIWSGLLMDYIYNI